MSEPTEALIQQAIHEAQSGNKEAARRTLSGVIKLEPDNTRAWYLLSKLVEKKEQEIYCLKKILYINPENEIVLDSLSSLENVERFETSPITPITQTKTCPFCRSEINIDASVCPHCGKDMSPLPYLGQAFTSFGSLLFGIGCLITIAFVILPLIFYLFI